MRYDPSLALYLPFWKRDGASFISDDAYGHLATVTGALWRPQGRDFDGVDDRISVPDHNALDLDSGFTFGIWFKLDTVALDQCLISKEAATREQIRLLFDPATKSINLEIYDGTNAPAVYTATNSIDTAGKWFNIYGVVNKGVNLQLYVDGIASGSPVTDNTGSIATTTPLYIGRRNTTLPLDGLVGEVILNNRVLNPLEIQRNILATKWRYV